jgi:hypothetical protein
MRAQLRSGPRQRRRRSGRAWRRVLQPDASLGAARVSAGCGCRLHGETQSTATQWLLPSHHTDAALRCRSRQTSTRQGRQLQASLTAKYEIGSYPAWRAAAPRHPPPTQGLRPPHARALHRLPPPRCRYCCCWRAQPPGPGAARLAAQPRHWSATWRRHHWARAGRRARRAWGVRGSRACGWRRAAPPHPAHGAAQHTTARARCTDRPQSAGRGIRSPPAKAHAFPSLPRQCTVSPALRRNPLRTSS